MDKKILNECRYMGTEIKDIKRRIKSMQSEINKLSIVSDCVKGTRLDGTYGSIRITGYPQSEYDQKKKALDRNIALLQEKEVELAQMMEQAERYIESVSKSELRTMFRLYHMDGLIWVQVAHQMNRMYPNRRIPYTEENCKQRHKRYFENI